VRSLVSTERLARTKQLVTEGAFKNLNVVITNDAVILGFLTGRAQGSVAPKSARGSKGFVTSVAEVLGADFVLELDL